MDDPELNVILPALWEKFGDQYFTGAEALGVLPWDALPKVVRLAVLGRGEGREPSRSLGRWLAYRCARPRVAVGIELSRRKRSSPAKYRLTKM